MSLTKQQRTRALCAVGTTLFVLIVDQLIKVMVKTHMSIGESIRVLGAEWFQIRFVENKGMAFGADFIGTLPLVIFRIAAVALFAYALVNIVKKCASTGLIICWACVVAGAAGNIIDNCFYGLMFTESGDIYDGVVATSAPFGEGYGTFMTGRVVDMFYFPLFRWPDWVPLLGGGTFFGAIFNFADSAITCGAIALVLFYRKHLSIDYLFRKNKDAAPTAEA